MRVGNEVVLFVEELEELLKLLRCSNLLNENNKDMFPYLWDAYKELVK